MVLWISRCTRDFLSFLKSGPGGAVNLGKKHLDHQRNFNTYWQFGMFKELKLMFKRVKDNGHDTCKM